MNLEKELKIAIEAGLLAKEEILKYYYSHFDIEIKDDNSPVTNADKAADKIISDYLLKHFPQYGLLTEESVDNQERLNKDFVWIVDPVDGTKDFIAKDDEFTTNIALVYKHEVVLGVVIIPAKNEYYFASKDNGSYHFKDGKVEKIHVNDKKENLTCYISVFHFNKGDEEVIYKHSDKIKTLKKVGSSIKACLIAKGEGEISYRMNKGTKEWDTAAFQIIVEEAGGYVLTNKKEKIHYNRINVMNEEPYIIINNIDNFLM